MMLPKPFTQIRYRMGTLMEIRLWSDSVAQAREAFQAAFEEIARLERLFSRFDPSSEVSRLNREGALRPAAVSGETIGLLSAGHEVARASGGAFDPTCGPWLELWERASREDRLPTSLEREAVRSRVGWRHLGINSKERTVRFHRPGMRLDLGASAKGYAVDRAVSALMALGIRKGLADAGGNFKIFGFEEPPWIGIENPRKPETILKTLPMYYPAVASSSNGLRGVEIQGDRFGHVVDPRTGWPAKQCAGTTVFSESALLADMLSTALFVLGPEGHSLLESFHCKGWILKVNEMEGSLCH